MRRHDLRQEREQADREICRSYQQRTIYNISSITITALNPNLSLGQKINACLRAVYVSLDHFENRFFRRGYSMFCNDVEREMFVNTLLNIIDNSDYMTRVHELPNYDPLTTQIEFTYGIIRSKILTYS